ncbi:MAG: hypothetical protein RDU83_07355 [bacterium]|nr:hypothetical protein [bacterium]
MRILLSVLAVLLLGGVGVLAFCNYRWQTRTADQVARVNGATAGLPTAAYSAAEIDGLPAPVQRYFRAVLRDGQPIVRRARLKQEGDFLIKPKENVWGPFTATQTVGVKPAGFVWDARIRMAPGIAVRVRDSFVDGRGYMHASLLATVPLVAVEGTPGIAAGALQRYLAEAVWYPTALLPSQGVAWSAIDGSSARATLSLAGVKVSLDFRFGNDGLMQSIYAADRPRNVDGRDVPTPWRGRCFEYQERGGMRIPVRCEVEWILPEGPQAYWRGRITEVSYE